MSHWLCPSNWHIQVFLSERRGRKRTLQSRLSSHCPSSRSLCILLRKADLYIFYLILSLTSIKKGNLPRRPLHRLIGTLTGMALFKCSCLMGYWQSCLIWPIRALHCANEEQKLENHGEGKGEGTWRRNWLPINWERTILHLLQHLKSSPRPGEG